MISQQYTARDMIAALRSMANDIQYYYVCMYTTFLL